MIDAVCAQLRAGPYLLGERFTAADVLWGGAFGWLTTFGIVDRTPLIAAYIERVASRPASVKVAAQDADRAAAHADRQAGASVI